MTVRGLLILPMLLLLTFNSTLFVFGQQQIPFEGMKLTYFSETTPTFKEETGIYATGSIIMLFHDVSASSSKMDIGVKGTVTKDGQQQPVNSSSTVDFPTDRDTLIFLRNGGQPSLTIYAGLLGLTIPIISGFAFTLPQTWNLDGTSSIQTKLGSFSAYKYRASLKSIQALGGRMVDVDFNAYYDVSTEVLVYGEIWATSGFSAMMEKLELRETNLQFRTQSYGPPRCVIATATYGSELSPEVQFLREFRDQQVMQTLAGREFMTVFNAWYYSFSPSIAIIIAENPLIKAVLRILLYLLIGILHLSAATYSILSFNPELAVVTAGLVASALIGVVYFSPFVLFLLSVCWKQTLIVLDGKPLAVAWTGSLILILIGEILSLPNLLIVGTSAFVLVTLSLSALALGTRIFRVIKR